MSKLTKALTAAAGNAGGDKLYVEDVFSTYLYTGEGAGTTITNGIDLADAGGLVWAKNRGTTNGHYLLDTASNGALVLQSNTTGAGIAVSPPYMVAQSTGYTTGNEDSGWNGTGQDMVSWTFRKAEKFFDVVTFTTTGTGGTQILSHNLGSVPAFILLKKTSSTGNWWAIHSSVTSPSANWWQNTGVLEGNIAFFQGDLLPSEPTDTEIALGPTFTNAGNEGTYVAYLFASDAGGFGDDGSESIIKCGSYTGNGSTDGPTIDCGFEPQWLMIKNTSGQDNWNMYDNMRGIDGTTTTRRLYADQSGSESDGFAAMALTATGFKITGTALGNASGNNYIYIAIRRPMKTPESGTEVFSPNAVNVPAGTQITTGFPVDVAFATYRSGQGTRVETRLLGVSTITGSNTSKYLNAFSTEAEKTSAGYLDGWNNIGHHQYAGYANAPDVYHSFKRATGFFDVVAYTGTGVAGSTQAHNLGVVPEMIIIKQRNASGEDWKIGVNFTATNNQERALNAPDSLVTLDYTSFGVFNGQPTAANITLNSSTAVNASSSTYIAYLFATLAGVSKVGSYTGTGSNVDVDCGFSAGARFILIKRTDSTGDWYVWDSARGIVAGNDPYLLLNSTAAEVTSTDYIDPLSSGFTVTSSAPAALNASGGTYIFMAIS